MMNSDVIIDYIDKIYGYAVKRTYSIEEADELSQEILLTIVRELPKLRDESRFEAWLWGVADNVTKSFRRKMGKQRAMYSYDFPEDLIYEDYEDYKDNDNREENEELYAQLRGKIAMLSKIYREIIILYYYDALSTKQISEKLCIPQGTVTWRLSESRKKLKKECTDMTETALRPVKLKLDIYGNGNFDGKKTPFPDVYINDALSQNILYYAYDESKTVEELSKLCGVPAYYIEERIDNLLKHDALIEAVKGKYQTDFIIWSDKYGIYCEENAEKDLLPVMDDMLLALKNLADECEKIDFYKADKKASDLFYLYGIMAFEFTGEKYSRLPFPQIREKYDGFKWCYLGNMETGKHHRIGINTLHCGNGGSRGSYTHTVYSRFAGIPRRDMMHDCCINACEDILVSGHSGDIDATTLAIEGGYINRKSDGSLFVTCPAFTKEQKAEFNKLADKFLAPLMERYTAAITNFISGYKKLFPKHLSDDADRMCRGMFKSLYKVIVEYGIRTEQISAPTPGVYCDVMIQFK